MALLCHTCKGPAQSCCSTAGHTELHSPGVVIGSKLRPFQTHHCPATVAVTPVRVHKTLITRSIYRDLQVERMDRSVWIGCCDKTARIMWILWIASATHRQTQRTHTCTKSVLCLFSVLLLQHWACVWSRSPAPQPAHHPPLLPSLPPSLFPSRCVSVGPPARSSLSFPASFHYRDGCESVQVGSPVVPEQRNGGRQPPGTCCLFTAAPSAHKTGKSQDVCVRTGEGKRVRRWRTGRAGPGRGKSGGSSYGSKAN